MDDMAPLQQGGQAVLDEPAAPAAQDHALVTAVLDEPAAQDQALVTAAPQDHALVTAVLDEPAAPAAQDHALVTAVDDEQAGDLRDQLVQQNAAESSSDEDDDGSTFDDWRAEGDHIDINYITVYLRKEILKFHCISIHFHKNIEHNVLNIKLTMYLQNLMIACRFNFGVQYVWVWVS